MIHPRTLAALEFNKILEYLAGLCESSVGRVRVLALKPLLNREEVISAAQIYEESAACFVSSHKACFNITSFPDISSLLEAAKNSDKNTSVYDIESFWALREILKMAQRVHNVINAPQAEQYWPNFHSFALAVPLPVQLLAALSRCISDDALVTDAASPELFRLRSEMRGIHQTCINKVNDFLRQYNISKYLQDEFITLSSDRYVLPLKGNFNGCMQGIIHDWSQTGETCYFEPMFLLKLNNRLQELKQEERTEEQNILTYLHNLTKAEIDSVCAAYELLVQLDVLQAKRRLAEQFNWNFLTLSALDEGINLLDARHPYLVLKHAPITSAVWKKEGSNEYHPVRPVHIQFRSGEQALIITGGNAGGKTVCLKTLGLITAMTFSGLPVPVAKGSHIPWFERVDAFIGDEQSLENSVSTFTSQVLHLAKIQKYLNNTSLVLLDEFGVGTDPAEGAALALAVCDVLLEQGTFILAATHFPALKSYALTRKHVRAASMLFDSKTQKPLYKLAYDQVGASKALHVAKECGLPQRIIDKAAQYLMVYGQDTSDIFDKLNILATEREKELENLFSERQKAQNILRQTKERFENDRCRLFEEIRSKAKELMLSWREGRAGHKQTLKEMARLRGNLVSLASAEINSATSAKLQIGQSVYLNTFKKVGIITGFDKHGDKLRLNLNGATVWANRVDVIPECKKTIQPERSASPKVNSALKEESLLKIDLRGMDAIEALKSVDHFVDKALLTGNREIEVIHGRGTGTLRREIHNFLRSNSSVEDFTVAPEGRGGDGMTIVRLR